MIENTKPHVTEFGCPTLGNCSSSRLQQPTNSLHYDAYYDNGYNSYDDAITTSNLISVRDGTDWRNPEHVYYLAVYGLDLLDVPQYKVHQLRAYCNAVSTNLQCGNINFNKD